MKKRGAAEIAKEMRDAISSGKFQRHERLPASRQLADEMGVARNTLRDALYQLEKEGLLETRPGSGTYVRVAATGEIRMLLSIGRSGVVRTMVSVWTGRRGAEVPPPSTSTAIPASRHSVII